VEIAGRVSPDIVRWLGGLLASVFMVAAVSSLVALLDPNVPAFSLLVLYVLVVLPVAILWGTGMAVLASVLSVGVFAYLFVPPVNRFELADWRSSVALGVFLVTAVVVGGLAARTRRAALESERMSGEQAALRRVASLVARGAQPSEVFAAVARELAAAFGASITAVLRYESDGTATVVGGWAEPGLPVPAGTRLLVAGHGVAVTVSQLGEAARTERFAGPPGSVARLFQDAGVSAGIGSPIVVGGRLWGIAVAASRKAGTFPAGTEHRITEFTGLAATAIANAEAQAQLMESRARVVASADETRRRIVRDLHDGAQQRLVTLALQLRMTQATVPAELADLGAGLDEVVTGLASALDELREYARGIHPAVLTERGLDPALKTLARRCPIPVDLDLQVPGRLPEPLEVGAYYVVSEALTNAAKYAAASRIAVHVAAAGGVLHVSVRDDGRGGADLTRGTGLVGINDRVEALRGRLHLDSPAGRGTTLRAEFPLGAAGAPNGTGHQLALGMGGPSYRVQCPAVLGRVEATGPKGRQFPGRRTSMARGVTPAASIGEHFSAEARIRLHRG
jgi:signal transduction histidine kinase